MRVLCPDKAKRKEQLEAVKTELKAGRVDAVFSAFAPHRHRDEAVAKCIDDFTANKAQMQYDKYRKQGMQIGSGVVESAGRQIVGLRMKRPGSHGSVTGANAVLAIKCCLTNHRWVDFLHWKAQQAVAAGNKEIGMHPVGKTHLNAPSESLMNLPPSMFRASFQFSRGRFAEGRGAYPRPSLFGQFQPDIGAGPLQTTNWIRVEVPAYLPRLGSDPVPGTGCSIQRANRHSGSPVSCLQGIHCTWSSREATKRG